MSAEAAEEDNVHLITNNVNENNNLEQQEEAQIAQQNAIQLEAEPVQLVPTTNIRFVAHRDPISILQRAAAQMHEHQYLDEYTFSAKRVPFWKQGPGWQMWVLAFQTLFLFGKLESSFLLGFLWTWMWDYWIVFLPTWVAITVYTGSLVMWIIKDFYKWRKSQKRHARRIRRHESRLEQLRATGQATNTNMLHTDAVRSPRSERRMLRKRVDRFYAYSILFGIISLIATLFMLTLKLDKVANISALAVSLPLLVAGFVHTFLTIVLLGFAWRQSPQNGGHYAIKNRSQTVFITSTVYLLLCTTAVLLALKIDYQILDFKLGYSACFSPLFVLNAITWLSAIASFGFSFYDQRQFMDMFKVHRDRIDDEEEANINVLLERRLRPMSLEEKKVLTMYRLDVAIFLLLQIPFNVFLVHLCFYLTREPTPLDVLLLFISPFVGELIGCIWSVVRRPITKLAYRGVSGATDDPVDIELAAAAPTNPEEGSPATPEQGLNPFMLLYMQSLMNENARMDVNGRIELVDARNNLTLLDWLQEIQSRGTQRRAPVGVSTEFLSILPTFTYEKKDHGDGEERITTHAENCSICLSDYEENETLRTLPCFHIFHRDCVDDWLKQSKVCPICKYQVDTVQRAENFQ